MEKKWWHDKVAYQIYPKSFCDSNGDGIGDIPGIISKLDYLKDLGVDIVWLSPCYPSPLADQGYDISDYYGIDPRFGTMEDVYRLIAEAKKRDMYILMDLVVNHCSDEHEWFQKACEDPDGKYGHFFYLQEKEEGKRPTNWRSYFGGSVLQIDNICTCSTKSSRISTGRTLSSARKCTKISIGGWKRVWEDSALTRS